MCGDRQQCPDLPSPPTSRAPRASPEGGGPRPLVFSSRSSAHLPWGLRHVGPSHTPGATSTPGPTASTSRRGSITTGNASWSSSVPMPTAARNCSPSKTDTARARAHPKRLAAWGPRGSWRELLLRRRDENGLATAPELATGDGALGFWKALHEVWSTTRQQRCLARLLTRAASRSDRFAELAMGAQDRQRLQRSAEVGARQGQEGPARHLRG